MKKIYIVFCILYATLGFSQVITVNTSNTANQLVNNILINSACVIGTNVNSSTGTNFGSTNGIGSFTNTNPNFPMTSGIILSTGNVVNAPGPNSSILSDGSLAWPGDAALASAIGVGGFPYYNASVLEFDFTPVGPNFSFDFVFASDEYGNFQCNPLDAFAFLLQDLTLGTDATNLAVIPSTLTPISVETIRDDAYNSGCASVNPAYFGNYFGGTTSGLAATNYAGQTVLMNASAVLIPGHNYHIKLVIADRKDALYDSAVFISGTSFNAGGDVLGSDLTIANHTAKCFGESYTIQSGLNPANYSIAWSGGGTPSSNGADLTVTSQGTYSLTYTLNGSTCPQTNSILVEYYPQITTITPKNIYKCNFGSPTYSYDIAQNTAYLLAGLPVLPAATTTIAYFSDAAATLPIASPYNAAPGTTVYVKIKDTTTGCSTIKPFQLLTTALATAPPPLNPPITVCASNSGVTTASIKLSLNNTAALNGQSPTIYGVSYYTNNADAIAGTNALNPTLDTVSAGTIYIRIENLSDPNGCPAFTSIEVIITPPPTILDVPKDILICKTDTYVLPPLAAGEEYWTGSHLVGTNPGIQHFAGDVISYITPPITIPPTPVPPIKMYVFLPGSCVAEAHFKITFFDLNLIPDLDITPHCDSYTLPSTEFGHYYTTNQLIPMMPQGEHLGFITAPLTTSQTVYFYANTFQVQPTPPNPPLPFQQFCDDQRVFNIIIDTSPIVAPFANVFECAGGSYTLPFFSTIPNVVTPVAATFPTSPTATINYYNGTNQTLGIIAESTAITVSQSVYVNASNGTKPCTNQKKFEVVIGLPTFADVSQCKSYKLPVLVVGKYYKLSGGPSVAGQVELLANSTITYSQNVFVYATSSSGCSEEKQFKVIIALPPIILPPSIETGTVKACADFGFTLPVLPAIPPNTNITPNQIYTPLIYNSLANGTGTTFNAGDVITSTKTIYIVAIDGINTSCNEKKPLIITIIPLPQILLDPTYNICSSTSYIAALAGGNYYYGPYQTLGIVPVVTIPVGFPNAGTPGILISADITLYAHLVSATVPPCHNDLPVRYLIDTVRAFQPANVTVCSTYTLPILPQPFANDNNQYFSASGGLPANLIAAGTALTSTQTVYVYNEKTTRISCPDEKSFTVTVNPNPVIPNIPPVISCGDYTLPALTVGNYFSQDGGLGTPYLVGDKITASQTVYVFAGNSTAPGCTTDTENFTVTINKVDKLNDITKCSSYTLPTLTVGNYFTASGGTGTPKFAGNSISTSQKIYIYKQFTNGSVVTCSDETNFNITIIPTPVANAIPPASTTFCDDNDLANDGNRLVDLTTFDAQILNPIVPPAVPNPQIGAQFVVGYFESPADANANTNPIIAPTIIKNIYVRVTNTLAPTCYDVKLLTITVNKKPIPTNPLEHVICADNVTGNIINPYTINSGLTAPTYSFNWTNNINTIVSTTSSLPNVILPGIYTLVTTNTATGCKETTTTTITQSQQAIATYSLSENFSDNQFITVTAIGSGGDYVYQLDNNPEQDSPVFTNVPYGVHTITIRDRNGCAKSTLPALVINYPKFFTPNEDGNNDTWNVIGLDSDLTSNIYIYDRFGKYVAQVKPSEKKGWDGTYNGVPLPSTDYWFSVTYKENNEDKIFKSHFTLKR
jgi:gliding motility-associated-like protein